MKKKLTREKLAGAAVKGCGVLLFFALVLANALAPFGKAHGGGEGFRLCFLDADEGDCAVACFPNGERLVVDAGDGSYLLKKRIDAALGDAPPEKITYVATHADYDHIGGMAELIKARGGSTVYLPVLSSPLRAYKNVCVAAEEWGISAKPLKRYDVCTFGDAYFVCISPYSAGETNENDASAVLYLSYAGVNFLLCGDISKTREERLLAEYETDETLFDSNGYTVRLDEVDILKVAHHGSASSSSSAWLSLLSPEVAVVSCGAGNLYGHPAGETLGRLRSFGCDIYRTDELGTVTVTVSPDGTYNMGWEK